MVSFEKVFQDYKIYYYEYFFLVYSKYFLGFHPDIPENREQFYDDWNNFIRAKIPKEKLFIFNLTTDLQELKSFLEK